MEGDCQLSVNGDTQLPAAFATLESIGNLGPKDNDRIAKLLTTFMEKEMGINPNR